MGKRCPYKGLAATRIVVIRFGMFIDVVPNGRSAPAVVLRESYREGKRVRMLKMLARVQLLILDDWGITPLT